MRTITFDDVTEIDLDGHVDGRGIQYVGKAAKQADGTWKCIAIVDSALCVVKFCVRPDWRVAE